MAQRRQDPREAQRRELAATIAGNAEQVATYAATGFDYPLAVWRIYQDAGKLLVLTARLPDEDAAA